MPQKITIAEIIEGCQLGGCSLEQRLATIEYSTIPALQIEARLLAEYLAKRREG